MFLQYLDHIRTQPYEARQRFAFVFSVVVTSVIVLVWLVTLFMSQSATKQPLAKTTPEEKGAFATMRDSARGFFGDASSTDHADQAEHTSPDVGGQAQFKNVFVYTPASSTPTYATTSNTIVDTTVATSTATTASSTPPDDTNFVESVVNEVQ